MASQTNLIERRNKRREKHRIYSSNFKNFMKCYGENGTNPVPQLFSVTRAEYQKTWNKFKRSWNDGILFNNGTQVEDSFASDPFIRERIRECLLIQRGHASMVPRRVI